MPTIVTVHGTFASGEATGTRWWQQGSHCEQALRELLVGTSGDLTYLPFIWDGENSEVSRRAAARRLLEIFQKLEAAGEPYIAIGHSHGGSVIAFALQLAAQAKLALPNLKRWITVGTPFIAFEKKRWLYARGDVYVKGAYVMAVLVVLAAAARYLLLGGGETNMMEIALAAGLALAGLGAATLAISHYGEGDKPDWRMLAPETMAAVDSTFSDRWTAYWHPADEAILGLRHAHAARSRLFPPDFASEFYLAALIPGLPLVAFLMALTGLDAYVAAFLSLTASAEAASEPVAAGLHRIADWYATPAELGATNLIDRTLMTVLAVPVLAARAGRWADVGFENIYILVFMLLAVTFAYIFLAKGVARLLSIPTSWALNALTLAQFRTLVNGVDVGAERAVGCGVCPAWQRAGSHPLPQEVCDEITAISDRAAMAALPKFRSALGELALAEKLDDVKARFAAYLTWDELIHTAYFHSPRFIYLLAETCAGTEGFAWRPRAAPRSA